MNLSELLRSNSRDDLAVLVNKNNSCRCHKQAGKKLASTPTIPAILPAIKRDGVVKGRAEAVAYLNELSEIERTAAMFRRYPEYQSPESFTYIVKDLIRSGRYTIFAEQPAQKSKF